MNGLDSSQTECSYFICFGRFQLVLLGKSEPAAATRSDPQDLWIHLSPIRCTRDVEVSFFAFSTLWMREKETESLFWTEMAAKDRIGVGEARRGNMACFTEI